MPPVEGNFFVTGGAVEGTLVPDGPATCTTTKAILTGTVGREDYRFVVPAPFADVTN